VLNKVSKDKVMTGGISGVKILHQLPAKRQVMQAVNIIDCPFQLPFPF